MPGSRFAARELIGTVLQEAIDAGSGDNYFPVIARHIDEPLTGDHHDHSFCRTYAHPQPRRRARRLVFTVAVAPDPVSPSMYEQSVKALARIDESLALCGTRQEQILSAIVYIADIERKGEMNRAWDEWVDPENPPMRACIGVDLEPPHIVEIVVTAAK